jgi:hypothetical protein
VDNEGLHSLFIDWIGTERKTIQADLLITGRVLLYCTVRTALRFRVSSSASRLKIGFGHPKRGMMGRIQWIMRTEIEGKMTLTRDEWLIINLDYLT